MVSVAGDDAFARSVGGEARSGEISGIADAVVIGVEGVEDADVMVGAGGDAVSVDASWINAVFFCLFDFDEEGIGDRGLLRIDSGGFQCV
jgi:hypothetical protein